ncbi:MAG TPA: hypothetical protein VGG74_04450 [Kofleriaceae bacterium]
MSEQPGFARTWLEQRRAGEPRLAELAREDLRALDDATALARSDALLAAVPQGAIAAERRSTSGFVEQQRRFARGRR